MNIETKDEIVLAVLKKMDERSIIGQKKYGATMIESARRCIIRDEIEEAMLSRVNVIAQNGNTGEHYE